MREENGMIEQEKGFTAEGIVTRIEEATCHYAEIQDGNGNSPVAVQLLERFEGKRVRITVEELAS